MAVSSPSKRTLPPEDPAADALARLIDARMAKALADPTSDLYRRLAAMMDERTADSLDRLLTPIRQAMAAQDAGRR